MTSESLIKAKSQLLDELTNEKSINRHRIRSLCREHPGLIAASSLRLKIWRILLLGKVDDSVNEYQDDIVYDSLPCEEAHVLENDVTRTRAEMEEFRSTAYRKAISIILQEFCKKHHIQYKQGMNEVLAPFIYLCPPVNQPKLLPLVLFEAFIFRYLERYFCLDDSSYLYKAFRLFHILLLYHDPQLANHLQDNDFPPELYSPQWFLTLYSRSLPMLQVLRLWDMIIAVDDPAFTFFVGLCLLRRLRLSLLTSESDSLPEVFRDMSFSGEEDIDMIMYEAMLLYRSTPRCFCRNLRLCCVSSAELSPSPVDINELLANYGKVKDTLQQLSLDRSMSVQSVRKSLMLTPQELISMLLPIDQDGPADLVDPSLAQFVLIDVRSQEDCETSGGGSIPRALSMDPEFLDQPDALSKWIQHFDGTRGCNICIIDLPPSKASSLSLWRRLLLGEGDGFASNNSLVRYGVQWVSNQQKKASDVKTIRDFESRFCKDEEEAIDEETLRPAVKLAMALHRESFPKVSVLDGGFPALVQQLMALRGSVEPLIINHQSEEWESFLKATGRDKYSIYYHSKQTSANTTSSDESRCYDVKTSADLSELEVTQIAYDTAIRLGHEHMAKILQVKISKLAHVSEPVHVDSSLLPEPALA
jgi:hypothetical protein